MSGSSVESTQGLRLLAAAEAGEDLGLRQPFFMFHDGLPIAAAKF